MSSKITKIIAITVALPTALFLTGCASRIGTNQYVAAGVGETMTSYMGVVVSKRVVSVKENQKLGDNSMGAGIGALVGGVAASNIGGGYGQVAATVGGAILGGFAGAAIEDHVGTQEAFEYTVQLDNGQLKTVVQGTDVNIQAGQRVIFHESYKGNRSSGKARSRIVPYMG